MATSLASILRWQFDLTWSLLDGHLQALSDEDYLWEPAPDCWTVRKGSTGFWSADWVEPEPDPAPVSTIGWTSWHIGWWWTEASAHLNGDVPAERVYRNSFPCCLSLLHKSSVAFQFEKRMTLYAS